MISSNAAFDIIELVTRAEKLHEGHAILCEHAEKFGLSHVAYLGLNIPSERRAKPLVAATYSPQWQRHYEYNDYVNLDPVVAAGIVGTLPIDWQELNRTSSGVKRLFGEAQEFDVGRQGLTFPIRGRHGEFALFSLNSPMNDREWARERMVLIKEFMLIAHYFHSWAVKAEKLDGNDFVDRLTARERECLRWSAAGKTIWETAAILGLSERTVRFHHENARFKLNALSTTHAVSKAIAYGVIPLP
jgi:DNA-binding CsgD family transcriptional regulator